MSCFNPGERILYSDIDHIIVDDLGPLLAECEGGPIAFCPNSAPGFRREDPLRDRVINSSFTVHTHGHPQVSKVFTEWEPGLANKYYGQQDWIGAMRPVDSIVLPFKYFIRGTQVIRREGGLREGVSIIRCTKAKNDEFVALLPKYEKDWK